MGFFSGTYYEKNNTAKKNLTIIQKSSVCKPPVMRMLRKTSKKYQKNSLKKLAEAEKGSTFAPATAKAFIEILAGNENQAKRNFQKKDSKKLARFENAFYICTPQNTESSLGDWRKN